MSNGMSFSGGIDIAPVKVHTTSNRGHSAEELCDMCVDRLIYIGDEIDPVLQSQALEYRDKIKELILHTCRQAQRSERTTMCAQLEEAGLSEAAAFLRRF